MTMFRAVSALLAASVLAACSGPSKEEVQTALDVQRDSVSHLRNELLEQVMTGSEFVNEINRELARARSLAMAPRQVQTTSEMVDVNEERKQIVSRIGQLVSRLDAVQARLASTRAQLTEKDSALSARVAVYERMMAEVNEQAASERAAFQAVIDSQTVRIASLTQKVDTLTGALGQLTAAHNAAYYVVGTREELIERGVLVQEGGRRYLIAGPRSLAPAPDLNPEQFVRIDRLSDTTIVLPEGEYKIISRQNGAYVTPQVAKGGKIAGGLKIEEPDQFWNASRFLIIVRS